MKEYAAISWRNFATSITRGFHSYWMDLCGNTEGWFGNAEIQQVVARQVEVVRDSINWKHEDVPGIAMIIDDAAVLETNGSGNYLNEAIMWETKMGHGALRGAAPHLPASMTSSYPISPGTRSSTSPTCSRWMTPGWRC